MLSRRILCIFSLLCLSGLATPAVRAAEETATASPSETKTGFRRAAVKVEIRTTPQGYALYRDGKPYFIQGAGGTGSLSLLKERGGNSVRTWGVDNLDKLLDEAESLGMTVTVGIWLGHERHGSSTTMKRHSPVRKPKFAPPFCATKTTRQC